MEIIVAVQQAEIEAVDKRLTEERKLRMELLAKHHPAGVLTASQLMQTMSSSDKDDVALISYEKERVDIEDRRKAASAAKHGKFPPPPQPARGR